jgi:hypothetical protein
MNNFSDYNDIVGDAFKLHSKQTEIIDRKKEIFDKIFEFYNMNPKSFLFVGFNPIIYTLPKNCEIFMTAVSDNLSSRINDKVSVQKYQIGRKVDCVVAFDEYLTFANSDEEQKNQILSLCTSANELCITTVKDYKNQDFKEREYSSPAIIKNQNAITAFTEIHNWDMDHKNSWMSYVYELNQSSAIFRGSFARRTMYFKQLAKFCKDFGATDFFVHKNLMYKSLIKKNYEHVVSFKFDR